MSLSSDTALLDFARQMVKDSNAITSGHPPGMYEDPAMALVVERLKQVWLDGFNEGVSEMAKRVSPPGQPVLTFTYTNWKGVTAVRSVRPLHLWFGTTPYHQTPGWLLRAIDTEKNEDRDFALDRIEWKR